MVDFTKKPRKKIGQEFVATSSMVEEAKSLTTTPMAAHLSTNIGKSHCNQTNDDDCIIDTGASDHMTNDPSKLLKTHKPKHKNICATNGSREPVPGEGPIKVSCTMDLDIVLVVPSLSSNLVLVSKIIKALNCYGIF